MLRITIIFSGIVLQICNLFLLALAIVLTYSQCQASSLYIFVVNSLAYYAILVVNQVRPEGMDSIIMNLLPRL